MLYRRIARRDRAIAWGKTQKAHPMRLRRKGGPLERLWWRLLARQAGQNRHQRIKLRIRQRLQILGVDRARGVCEGRRGQKAQRDACGENYVFHHVFLSDEHSIPFE